MTIDICKPLSQNEIIEHLWKTLSIITYSTKREKDNDIIWFFMCQLQHHEIKQLQENDKHTNYVNLMYIFNCWKRIKR